MAALAQEVPSWADAAAAVADAVDVLAQAPAADLADAQLAGALEDVAVQASRLQALAVRVAMEADARRVWRAEGASSLLGWVRRCVQVADDAARLVTAARMLPSMPKMAMLFHTGQVSLAQMGAAARQVRRLPDRPAWPDANSTSRLGHTEVMCGREGPGDSHLAGGSDPARGTGGAPDGTSAAQDAQPADAASPAAMGAQMRVGSVEPARWGDLRTAADDILAERAPTADARALGALGEQIYAAADPGDYLGEAVSKRERRHLSIVKSFEGMGEVTGRLDPETAERAITVLNGLSQTAGPEDDRTAAQRRADAFDLLCKAWLESGRLPAANDGRVRRDRVLVTIPYWTLAGLPGAGGATLNGTAIPAETARRMACDASIRRVVMGPVSAASCVCSHACSFPTYGSLGSTASVNNTSTARPTRRSSPDLGRADLSSRDPEGLDAEGLDAEGLEPDGLGTRRIAPGGTGQVGVASDNRDHGGPNQPRRLSEDQLPADADGIRAAQAHPAHGHPVGIEEGFCHLGTDHVKHGGPYQIGTCADEATPCRSGPGNPVQAGSHAGGDGTDQADSHASRHGMDRGGGHAGRDSVAGADSQVGRHGMDRGSGHAGRQSVDGARRPGGMDSPSADGGWPSPERFNATAWLAAILRTALAALPPPLGVRSAVIDAGRTTPTFTQPMRDALHAQYGGRCTFPRCDQPATVDHHIIHWSRGGPTSVANGAPLCEYHHYLVHEGGWTLHKDVAGNVTAVPPPSMWRGPLLHWRNGRPIAGAPPDKHPQP